MTACAFFIVSSGRSGTAMLHKALSRDPAVEMNHEYMVHVVQPLAIRRYLGLADRDNALKILRETHVAAVRYRTADRWGDSSNKLSWLIPELAELLPSAKFVHLVRDGRKVASSYFHKLAEECYDDRSTQILQAHYDRPAEVPPPPPEKKYWWPVPRHDDPVALGFKKFDRFERIAWHWCEINRVILESLRAVHPDRQIFVRLEDLVRSAESVRRLFAFLELEFRDEHFAAFARPHNVNRPEDRLLDGRQQTAFAAIASAMMERLGYAQSPEYVVNY